MPNGSKPGEYRGGRRKGTPNKATVAKNEQAKAAERIAAEIGATPEQAAALHRSLVEHRQIRAKDELELLIPVVKGHVSHFQQAAMKAPPGQEGFNPALWKTFKDWIELYIELLGATADFQDARLKATALVVPPPPERPASDAGQVVRLGDPVRAARAYQELVQRPRQLALPPASRLDDAR